jgi:hypothetical protein
MPPIQTTPVARATANPMIKVAEATSGIRKRMRAG